MTPDDLIEIELDQVARCREADKENDRQRQQLQQKQTQNCPFRSSDVIESGSRHVVKSQFFLRLGAIEGLGGESSETGSVALAQPAKYSVRRCSFVRAMRGECTADPC